MRGEIEISVSARSSAVFEVRVKAASTTSHEVTLTPSYYKKLTDGRVTPEKLIEESFKFLLERESNTSILSHFALPLINSYFPEYEETIKRMLD